MSKQYWGVEIYTDKDHTQKHFAYTIGQMKDHYAYGFAYRCYSDVTWIMGFTKDQKISGYSIYNGGPGEEFNVMISNNLKKDGISKGIFAGFGQEGCAVWEHFSDFDDLEHDRSLLVQNNNYWMYFEDTQNDNRRAVKYDYKDKTLSLIKKIDGEYTVVKEINLGEDEFDKSIDFGFFFHSPNFFTSQNDFNITDSTIAPVCKTGPYITQTDESVEIVGLKNNKFDGCRYVKQYSSPYVVFSNWKNGKQSGPELIIDEKTHLYTLSKYENDQYGYVTITSDPIKKDILFMYHNYENPKDFDGINIDPDFNVKIVIHHENKTGYCKKTYKFDWDE